VELDKPIRVKKPWVTSDEGTVSIEPDPEDANLMILMHRPHA